MYKKLDSLCAGLWGIDEKGVTAVQDAFSELYTSGPKEKATETEAEE